MSVKDIDKGWNRIVNDLDFFAGHDVVMGWVEGQKENRPKDEGGAKLTNATLAAVHEFGTRNGRIPPGRLGLREWADRRQDEIGRRLGVAFSDTIKKGKPKRQLNLVGLWAVSDWRKYLRDVQPGPPWRESTRKAKLAKLGPRKFAQEKKLIVTGQLINGATHQVRRERGG